MMYSLGLTFSTWDADHSGNNCAAWAHGAWWYLDCYSANLNGLYNGKHPQDFSWDISGGVSTTLKTSTMMIRPGAA